MRVVLYTSAGGFVFEAEWPEPLPDVFLWADRVFVRNDAFEMAINGQPGYVEATVGTLPARTDA